MNETQLRLPRLVGDGMVLQREARVKIWGWAPAGETITIVFINNVYRAAADETGKWLIDIKTGNAGGPYQMEIEAEKGKEKVTVKDILIGDVWLCSGQSNMEMKIESVKDTYTEEVAQAENNYIRQFLVPVQYDFDKPQNDFETGSWEVLNPQSVLNFTAVGYFFAQKLYKEYRVPIGLINASLGGSPIEAWMSEEALTPFEEALESAKKLRDREFVQSILKEEKESIDAWYGFINKNDKGLISADKPCYDTSYDASVWPLINVPSFWEDEGLGHFNGVVWFRKEVNLPAELTGKAAKLYLGNIVNEDTVYINGIRSGTTPNQYIPRKYELPHGLLKAGKNIITVRVINGAGKGGFTKDKPYKLQIGDREFDLTGEWQYLIGVKSGPMPTPAFLQWRPLGLYNSMIAPMTDYAIKGATWYQGESNTLKPKEYEYLFKALIKDWRNKWKQDNFPFLFVQLPNFMEASDFPSESSWAEFREAQRRTLELPDTGMAVAIDLGEWNDIHPVNKKDVGSRLALAAQKVAYGDDKVVAYGPMLQSVERDGNRLIITFSNTGSGLIARAGDCDQPGHFAISGSDKVFVWAHTKIDGNTVIAWNEEVAEPVHARYAWADNPEGANLYNQEGLPASPFTTE